VPNVDDYPSIHKKTYQATMSSPPEQPPGSGKATFEAYDLSCDVEDNLMAEDVADTTPRRSDQAAPLLNTARLYLYSLPE